jgi:hypothetical protein
LILLDDFDQVSLMFYRQAIDHKRSSAAFHAEYEGSIPFTRSTCLAQAGLSLRGFSQPVTADL